jgi:hypothetical protein
MIISQQQGAMRAQVAKMYAMLTVWLRCLNSSTCQQIAGMSPAM